MIKVAIFDDNHARRESLKYLLQSMEGMQFVGAYEDCRDIEFRVKSMKPDVVLMDINMPYVNGIQGLTIIKEKFSDIKVIMQTIFEDENKILEAICAGADGYILKQKSPMKLIEGILEVVNGGAPMTPIVAKKVLKLFNSPRTLVPKSSIKLTNREREILGFLVEGFSYKMIADKCFVSYATVNKHISNIYSKLQVNSMAGAVSKALKEGLV